MVYCPFNSTAATCGAVGSPHMLSLQRGCLFAQLFVNVSDFMLVTEISAAPSNPDLYADRAESFAIESIALLMFATVTHSQMYLPCASYC